MLRDRVINQWNEWNYNFIEDIESLIERELTDEEILTMIIYIAGYYAPNSGIRSAVSFLDDIGLESIGEKEYDKLKDKTIEI